MNESDFERAQQMADAERDNAVRAARAAAEGMPKGKPGDCDLCGEWAGRLVDGVCAPCRDQWGLG